MDFLIRGYLCDPAAGWDNEADILIRNGYVEAVFPKGSPNIADVLVLDFGQHLLLPGLVDIHVHFREPGGEHKETIASGSAAAVAGGFTSVVCMPNTSPTLDNAALITYVKESALKAGLARVYPVGAVTLGQQGEEMTDMEQLALAGAVAFSDDGRPIMNSNFMLEALNKSRELDRLLIAHCEDLSLSAGGVVYGGKSAQRLGLPVVSKAAEPAMLARDLVLLQESGGMLHIAHLSTRKSTELLRLARKAGAFVSAEVTPHHLLLTDEAVETCASDAKMNPPLGSRDDLLALQDALFQGYIDMVATDHAPHSPKEKGHNLLKAPFGVVGLETSFSLLFSSLVDKGHMTLPELVRVMSTNPARRLGIPGGTLVPGSPADLVVVDCHREWTVDKSKFYSQGENTPFQGWSLRGQPVMTMVGGEIKMVNGKVKGISSDFPCLEEIIS